MPPDRQPALLEADVVPGLEPVTADEIARCGGTVVMRIPGRLQFVDRRVPPLQTALAVYSVRHFPIPRPRALLGDQHLRAFLRQIDDALAQIGAGVCHTFMLGAAGKDTEVMRRLRAVIAEHTGLVETDHEGDLLIRLRSAEQSGWEALVRLSPQPLSTRPWRVCLVPGALQATVARAMVQLIQPHENDVYLNVCCGSGTLLIERALAGRARRIIGCDINPEALRCAERNCAAYQALAGAQAQLIELHDWDARALPLAEGSVHEITADLPFGHTLGSAEDNRALYPAILSEAARVCAPGGRCAVITADADSLRIALAALNTQWKVVRALPLTLGKSSPTVWLLHRIR